MRTKNRSIVVAPAILAVAAALLTIPPSPATAQHTPLGLSISSPESSYLVAEPVVIRLLLTNRSDAAVTLSPELALETELTTLWIAAPGEDFVPYDPGFVEEPSRPQVTLEPGETLDHDQLVLYHWPERRFAFPEPGTYRVKVVHHGFGVRPDAVSPTLELTIGAPSASDAAALELFEDRQVALLALGLDEPQEAVSRLETLARRYPTSPYSDYARFFLARRQTHGHFARRPNPEKAQELYEELLRQRPEFPLAGQVYYELGKIFLDRNEPARARESLDRALQLSSDTLLGAHSRRLLEHLERIEPPKGE